MNVVSCWPGKTPTKKQVNACSFNAWDQLMLCDPAWVLCVGGVAMQSLFPWQLMGARGCDPKKITEMRGICWYYKSRYWMSCIHPAAGLRTDAYLHMFIEDIIRFIDLVKHGPNWSEVCFVCHAEVFRYTAEGIPFCEAHLP